MLFEHTKQAPLPTTDICNCNGSTPQYRFEKLDYPLVSFPIYSRNVTASTNAALYILPAYCIVTVKNICFNRNIVVNKTTCTTPHDMICCWQNGISLLRKLKRCQRFWFICATQRTMSSSSHRKTSLTRLQNKNQSHALVHGAAPFPHNSLRSWYSRLVSMHCQKPSWR